MASWNGHCGIVRMLLEAKADVHNKTNVSHAAWWCLCTLLIPWLSVPLCMSGLSSGECTISWSSCCDKPHNAWAMFNLTIMLQVNIYYIGNPHSNSQN